MKKPTISMCELQDVLITVAAPEDVSATSATTCRYNVLRGIEYLTYEDPKWIYKIKKPIDLRGNTGRCPLAQVGGGEFAGAALDSDLAMDELAALAFTPEIPYNEAETIFKNALWNKAVEWIKSLLTSQLPRGVAFFWQFGAIFDSLRR